MPQTTLAPISQGTATSTCDAAITTAKTVSGSATNVIDPAPSWKFQEDSASPVPPQQNHSGTR
jgi:hypothetical protein